MVRGIRTVHARDCRFLVSLRTRNHAGGPPSRQAGSESCVSNVEVEGIFGNLKQQRDGVPGHGLDLFRASRLCDYVQRGNLDQPPASIASDSHRVGLHRCQTLRRTRPLLAALDTRPGQAVPGKLHTGLDTLQATFGRCCFRPAIERFRTPPTPAHSSEEGPATPLGTLGRQPLADAQPPGRGTLPCLAPASASSTSIPLRTICPAPPTRSTAHGHSGPAAKTDGRSSGRR